MKRQVIRNIILSVLCSSVVLSSNIKSVQAAWKQDAQNNWYWNENGKKATGWKLLSGKWYYFYSNGTMAVGWIKDGGRWYYLSSSGAMVTGWLKDTNEKWYHLSSSGAMDTGWILTGGKWYHLSQSGAMNTGWLNDKDKKYYLDPSGAMVIGNINIDGIEYTFSENGELIKTNNSTNNPAFDKEENKPGEDEKNEEKRIGYVATKSSPLNMRTEPSANASLIISIPKNSKITIIGKEINGFYKIEYKNKIGYASSEWISFEKPQVTPDNSDSSGNTEIVLGAIRTTGPEKNSRYYYSDDNIFYKVKLSPPFTNSNGKPIVGNCTWYAYGRIWEMTGHIPYDAGFTGNAYEWWNANIRAGKYKYGSTPKKGALAVWKSSLPNSGGSGHVAVIEKIENNKIYISESSWHGSYFNYREIYNTNYLYGYIYIDEPNF